MKWLICILVLLICQTGFAMLPANDANLQKAMLYGVARSDKQEFSDEQLLAPWSVPDSLQTNPYRYRERGLLYTPYMLAALQSRNLAAAKQKFYLTDIKNFVQQYQGITVLGVAVNAPLILKDSDFQVVLRQGQTQLAPYANDYLRAAYLPSTVSVDAAKLSKAVYLDELKRQEQEIQNEIKALALDQMAPEDVDTQKTAGVPKLTAKVARIEMQFYFDNKKFDTMQPYQLIITDPYCGKRSFSFDPQKVL